MLNIFMFVTFCVGLLLLISSFSAFSKIKALCTSGRLLTLLRLETGLGSAFVSIALGYMICIRRCNCNFGDLTDMKMIVLLSLTFIMGLLITVISFMIWKELKNCKVNLGWMSWAPIALGLAEVLTVIVYTVYRIKSKRKKDEEKDEEKGEEKEKDEEDVDETMSDHDRNIHELSTKQHWQQESLRSEKSRLLDTEEKLYNLNQQIGDKKGSKTQQIKKTALTAAIARQKKKIKKITAKIEQLNKELEGEETDEE